MGDKDTDKLFGNPEILIGEPGGELKPLGKVVECSTSLESEKEADYVHTTDSFSFSCEMPILSKWFEENANLKPIREAQDMLTRLRDYHALWHKYYGFGMRNERRKIERNFNTLAQRFALHCKIYNITIQSKKTNEHKD
jgi:hypothetical protein